MRYTRHAKNQARRLRMSDADVERVIARPMYADTDEDGKPRFVGEVHGVRVRVVLALDEPDLVVTIHPRRH
jgi:hypothetical protein